MGNEISSEQFKGKYWPEGNQKLLAPVHLYKANDELYGCGPPGQRENFLKLESMGIKLLIVALADQLNNKKITNNYIVNLEDRKSCRQENTGEYYHSPNDYLKDVSLEILYLPIDDGQPPDQNTVTMFLKQTKKTIEAGHKVCVMCWTGYGRAATLISTYLMTYSGFSYNQTIKHLKKITDDNALHSKYQQEFLQKFSLFGNEQKTYQIPKCRLCSRNGVWQCSWCSQRICHHHKNIKWRLDSCLQVCHIESKSLRKIYQEIVSLISIIQEQFVGSENIKMQFVSILDDWNNMVIHLFFGEKQFARKIQIPEHFSEQTKIILGALCQETYYYDLPFNYEEHAILFSLIQKNKKLIKKVSKKKTKQKTDN